MNIRDFIDYRKTCPLCDSDLVLLLHSGRQQKIRYEGGRTNVIFNLDGIKKKHIDYKVGYSFGNQDNSFAIEFYTKDEKRFGFDSPIFLINRFKELDKNLKSYTLYKNCHSCWRYWYQSDKLNIDFKNACASGFEIISEYFGMTYEINGEIKVCKLLNRNDLKESSLSCFTALVDAEAIWHYSVPSSASSMILPIIKFVSKEETLDRIKKLLLFS